MTYFGPALDPPLDRSGRKTTTLVRDHEYFIPTKFHQNPSSGSGEEVENVKSLRTYDGRRTDRQTDGRTDDGRCAMTIAHSSLRLRWAKKQRRKVYSLTLFQPCTKRSLELYDGLVKTSSDMTAAASFSPWTWAPLKFGRITSYSSGRYYIFLMYYFHNHICFCTAFLWPLCFGWLLVTSLYTEDYLQIFNRVSSWLHSYCG